VILLSSNRQIVAWEVKCASRCQMWGVDLSYIVGGGELDAPDQTDQQPCLRTILLRCTKIDNRLSHEQWLLTAGYIMPSYKCTLHRTWVSKHNVTPPMYYRPDTDTRQTLSEPLKLVWTVQIARQLVTNCGTRWRVTCSRNWVMIAVHRFQLCHWKFWSKN